MLLSTGERIACALVAMAIHDLGEEAVSYTGSQAGILTDSAHTKAKIREIRGDRIRASLEEGKIVLVAGFQGFSRDTMDITTLGRGAGDLDRRRARGDARGGVRDPLRRRRRVHGRPADRPGRPQDPASSRTTRCSRWPRPAPRCWRCGRSSSPATTACGSTPDRRSQTRREPGCRTYREWSSRSSRRSPTRRRTSSSRSRASPTGPASRR